MLAAANTAHQVAMGPRATAIPTTTTTISMTVESAGSGWVDIGWCDPSVSLNGSIWMGWQHGKAWVYRASGL